MEKTREINHSIQDIAAENHYDEVRQNGERRLSFLGQQYPLKVFYFFEIRETFQKAKV